MAAEPGAQSCPKDGGAREVEPAATEQPVSRDPAKKSWADIARASASSSSAAATRVTPKNRASLKAVGVAAISDDAAAGVASTPSPAAAKTDVTSTTTAATAADDPPLCPESPSTTAKAGVAAAESSVVDPAVTPTAAPVAPAKVSDTAAPSVTAQVAVPIAVPAAASPSAAAAAAPEKRQDGGAASTSWAARLLRSQAPPPSPAKAAGAKAQSKEGIQRPVTPTTQLQTPKAASAERPSPNRAEAKSPEATSAEKPPSQAKELAAPAPAESRPADANCSAAAAAAAVAGPETAQPKQQPVPSVVIDRSPEAWPVVKPGKTQVKQVAAKKAIEVEPKTRKPAAAPSPPASPAPREAVAHAKVQQPKAALSTSRAPWAKARHQDLPVEVKESEEVPAAPAAIVYPEDKKCELAGVPDLDAAESPKPPAVSSKDVVELAEEADSSLDVGHDSSEKPADSPLEKPVAHESSEKPADESPLEEPVEPPVKKLAEETPVNTPLELPDESAETPEGEEEAPLSPQAPQVETPHKVTRYTVEFLRSLQRTPAASGPCPETIPGPMRIGDDSLLATPTGFNGNRRQLYSKNSSKDLAAMDGASPDTLDQDGWRSHRRQNSGRETGRDKARRSWRQESEQPLVASENSWAAGRQVRKQNEDENVPRAMKAILNKLTVEKFDTLFQKLLEVGISTRTHVEQLVREVFEKATTQHHFCEMYTDLCIKFNLWLSEQGMVDESGKQVVFRKILLNQCQDSFETYLKPPVGLDQLTGDDQFEAKMKYKTKMLGNMKLIGLLVCNKVMTSRVISDCIFQLTSLKSEETLETLCTFLVSIGPVFDAPDSKSKMILVDAFNQVKILSSDKEVPFRVRCKLKDVLDLRAAGWQKLRPSGAPEGPSSMAEVKSQWVKDHNVAVDRRSTYTRGASAGDWETVPGSRRGGYGD